MTLAEFGKAALAHFYTATTIAMCLFLGKFIKALVGGLPASIYGMIIFAGLLRSGLVSSARVSGCIDIYIKYMLIVYAPTVLGVMEFSELFLVAGWKIVLVAVPTTVIGIVLAGVVAQKVLPAVASSEGSN